MDKPKFFMGKCPVVEAMEFTGFNWEEIKKFCPGSEMVGQYSEDMKKLGMRFKKSEVDPDAVVYFGEWLVKDSEGRFFKETEQFLRYFVEVQVPEVNNG